MAGGDQQPATAHPEVRTCWVYDLDDDRPSDP